MQRPLETAGNVDVLASFRGVDRRQDADGLAAAAVLPSFVIGGGTVRRECPAP